MDLYEKLSAERKSARDEGIIPDWMTTGGYQMWREKLKYKDESFKTSLFRVAKEATTYAVRRDYFRRSREELFDRFFSMIWDGWLALATPVQANMGTDRGLPVSCSGSYIMDSIDGFYSSYHEAAILTKTGHGCSCYLGDIRPRGASYGGGEGVADGVLPVLQQMLATVSNVSQGSTRRGATAFYIPMSHGDIREVLDFHLANPKRLQVGYIFDKEFEWKCERGESNAVSIYKRWLKVRAQGGKAYIVFPEKANAHAKELGIPFEEEILASNLCTEIFLPSSEDLTFSCIISSVNAYKFDEWKNDRRFIHDCILFLNAVTDSYLESSKDVPGMERIRNFTKKYRALGLGVLGFCSYLQKQSVPLESLAALHFNKEFFEDMYKQARVAGNYYGNATVMAVAPNVSSALVCGGVSQGIEPFTSNVFTQETAAGDIYRMNPELLSLMKKKMIDTEANIQRIKRNNGSILGMDDLFSEHEQDVFKTAYEVDQSWLVKLAGDRGKYIDQGQSLNTFFTDSSSEEYVSRVHQEIREHPYVKSAYYFNTAVGVQGSDGTCMMCES